MYPAVRRRNFAPRFDVRELKGAFELQGELPGVRQEDLDVEFADENTLVIRGRTQEEFTTTVEDKAAESPATLTEGQAVDENTSRQPTVEDEYVDAGAESEGVATPATTVAATEPTEVEKPITAEEKSTTMEQEKYRYWVSERTTGQFERRFKFPGQVDQEAVKASLKHGILSVVVPKVLRKEKKIVVE